MKFSVTLLSWSVIIQKSIDLLIDLAVDHFHRASQRIKGVHNGKLARIHHHHQGKETNHPLKNTHFRMLQRKAENQRNIPAIQSRFEGIPAVGSANFIAAAFSIPIAK